MAVVTHSRQPSVVNLPNGLSASRLFLAAGLFVCVSAAAWWTGLAILVVAAVTDWLDGYLARRYNQTSSFGRVLDPLTDKVLICGAFIFLLPVRDAGLEPWMVTVVVARELLITGLRGFLEQRGAVFGADWLGKLKMVRQCADLIAILLALGLPEWRSLVPWAAALTCAMLAATI